MAKKLALFYLSLLGTFLIDQWIKKLFVEGFSHKLPCISLFMTLNKGVAFSLLAFLGPYLKWLLLALIIFGLVFVYTKGYLRRYAVPLGILFGAALGNLYDRFIYGGVVDYVYWHCWFDFAVFNFADVMIDFSILWILLINFKKK